MTTMQQAQSNPQPPKAAFDIVLAGVPDLPSLTPLFDAYRMFYGQASNLPAAEHFLFERIINHDSVIYQAVKNDGSEKPEALGFAQLYPSFSSVSMQPVWILNDLFVNPAHRRQGVATALIRKALSLATERGDKGVTLSTGHENASAQKLYEALGFVPDQKFQYYQYWV